jgi:F-type H+-transporting ATPase subunit b
MRFRWLALGALVFSSVVFGAEQKNDADEGKWLPWQWANFVILAGGLGYLIGKNVPGFFRARTAAIQKDINESTLLQEQADAKVREIEQRLASLATEIEALRAEAGGMLSAEGQRIRKETEHHLERLRQQTQREIDSMTRVAREELHAYAARLALDLAEERIRARMDQPAQARLVDAFTRQLGTARPEERQ